MDNGADSLRLCFDLILACWLAGVVWGDGGGRGCGGEQEGVGGGRGIGMVWS
jgi:hypothetical protein